MSVAHRLLLVDRNGTSMTLLITGTAGFIGNHLAYRLLRDGTDVVGVDSLTPYYDTDLKQARLDRLTGPGRFVEERIDICDAGALKAVFERHRPESVVHLAAQPGVRYSIDHPDVYFQTNLLGFGNMLECCRALEVKHLVYASTSSVYGANLRMPYSEHHSTEHPVSLYAATKKANEMMAHSYSHLYRIPTTGLRFFTVYGEWGRPDMAFFKFTDAILNDRPIEVFNHGRMTRDFTYVQDIVEGIMALVGSPPEVAPNWQALLPDTGTSGVAPYRIYNIGNSEPVELKRYIEVLEACIGRKAIVEYKDMQPGDVVDTWADCSALAEATGYSPDTPVETGLANFVNWYKRYYGVN